MARESYMKGITGVFGWPVAENPTIIMQQAAFDAMDLEFVYLNFEVREEDLEKAVKGARAMGFAGFNCTIPHKTNVIKYLDEISQEAELMGAVNTVYIREGRLIGANTDGKGFLTSLKVNGIKPEGKRAVILGAGGAARAISVELSLNGAEEITIVNRSSERGKTLVKLINDRTNTKASFEKWNGEYEVPKYTDLLINATNIGLYPDKHSPNVDFDTIRSGMIVCDVIPNPPKTAFLLEARKRGAKCLDGLGMLVYQGAIAFEGWTGQEAPVEVMIEALEEEFGL